jgi:hypothetical protein
MQITISRLYNLGSYEHVKYEIAAEVPKSVKPSDFFIGLEKILKGLDPRGGVPDYEIEREDRRVSEMLSERNKIGDEEFRRKHGFFEGTPLEYIARLAKSVEENKEKRDKYKERHRMAREALDNIGGEAKWKDAKLDWE